MYEQRRQYRKSLHTNGRIEIDGKEQAFISEDISVQGMRIHVETNQPIEEDTLTTVHLDDLGSVGQALIVWVMPYIGGGSFIGLRLTHLEGVAAMAAMT